MSKTEYNYAWLLLIVFEQVVFYSEILKSFNIANLPSPSYFVQTCC